MHITYHVTILFRVLGIAVTDIEGDDDEPEQADDDDDDDDPDLVVDMEEDSSKNLFESAKSKHCVLLPFMRCPKA